MENDLLKKEYSVTLKFYKALEMINGDKKIVCKVRQAVYTASKKQLERAIFQDSFKASLFQFETEIEMQRFFKEKKFRPGSVFELLPLLISFPKLKEIDIVAFGSYISVEYKDLFHLFSNSKKNVEKFNLDFSCYSKCCFEFKKRENFFVLAIKE